jgi:hypothetical protein
MLIDMLNVFGHDADRPLTLYATTTATEHYVLLAFDHRFYTHIQLIGLRCPHMVPAARLHASPQAIPYNTGPNNHLCADY